MVESFWLLARFYDSARFRPLHFSVFPFPIFTAYFASRWQGRVSSKLQGRRCKSFRTVTYFFLRALFSGILIPFEFAAFFYTPRVRTQQVFVFPCSSFFQVKAGLPFSFCSRAYPLPSEKRTSPLCFFAVCKNFPLQPRCHPDLLFPPADRRLLCNLIRIFQRGNGFCPRRQQVFRLLPACFWAFF